MSSKCRETLDTKSRTLLMCLFACLPPQCIALQCPAQDFGQAPHGLAIITHCHNPWPASQDDPRVKTWLTWVCSSGTLPARPRTQSAGRPDTTAPGSGSARRGRIFQEGCGQLATAQQAQAVRCAGILLDQSQRLLHECRRAKQAACGYALALDLQSLHLHTSAIAELLWWYGV